MCGKNSLNYSMLNKTYCGFVEVFKPGVLIDS